MIQVRDKSILYKLGVNDNNRREKTYSLYPLEE